MPLHFAVLFLTLVHSAYAAAPAVSSTTPAGTPGQPHEVKGPTKEDFDEIYKKDLKILESDLKDQVKFIQTRFTRETELDRDQLEKKVAFQKAQRDARIAFEKTAFDKWKDLMKRLRELDPVAASAERAAFDEKSIEERNKFNEDSMVAVRAFMEEQNQERTRFWTEIQKVANETRRVAREHETKVGKGATER